MDIALSDKRTEGITYPLKGVFPLQHIIVDLQIVINGH